MNKQEVETKLQNIITHVEKTGVHGAEVKQYYDSEFALSLEMGMSEEDSYLRSLISTVNFYRKKLDKMGNRITFLCLGTSQPTDYGLSKKIKDIKKKWMSSEVPQADKMEMIDKGIVNKSGIPLHTTDTTFLESKIGFPIVLDEEYSQNLIGVVKQEDKIFPAIIRLYGKKECDIPKIMYTWSSISADQMPSKNHPNYISLVSRELGMMIIPNSVRISIDEYKAIIENEPEFNKIVYDISDKSVVDSLNTMCETPGVKYSHMFIKNSRITGYTQYSSNFGTTSELTSNNINDVTEFKAPIIADLRIPDHIELNVDPTSIEELWLIVLPREKKAGDKRIKFEVLGMFVNTPGDRSKFKMKTDFLEDVDQIKLISGQRVTLSREMESVHKSILNM